MNRKEVVSFIRRYGVVLQSARGPVPNLAERIAGGPIRGSWWSHPKGRLIYRATRVAQASPEILVCRLVDGKVTLVHRRLWPALVKLSQRFPKDWLARTWDVHTSKGRHMTIRIPFPRWVPRDVMRRGKSLSLTKAERLLSPLLQQARPASRRSRSARVEIQRRNRHS